MLESHLITVRIPITTPFNFIITYLHLFDAVFPVVCLIKTTITINGARSTVSDDQVPSNQKFHKDFRIISCSALG